jgi:hypothetical protein
MKLAVACNDLVIAGGLIRFERIGQCIAACVLGPQHAGYT